MSVPAHTCEAAIGSGGFLAQHRTCPRCGMVTRWSGEVVFTDREPAETVTYWQCRRCSHLWVPDPPRFP